MSEILLEPSPVTIPSSNAIKAILFDCFGVIYNDVVLNFLDDHQIDYRSSDAQYRKFAHASDAGKVSLDAFFGELSRLTRLELQSIKAELSDVSHLNEELISRIEVLRRRYRIGMLSDAPGGFLDPFLDNQNIRRLFDAVVISSQVGYTKPDREIFSIAAKRLGAAFSEIVFIDNSANNVRAAAELGMIAIMYQDNQQLMRDLGAFVVGTHNTVITE